ncbi:hypothetical protein, partial [Novacetimonas hansenii]|uniref:hypothetical protein n=1 Tax=Novacetimonas hansenii TaxID=436 RepID=UPI00248F347C
VVDDCPYPQSSAKNQSNRFLIQALRDRIEKVSPIDREIIKVFGEAFFQKALKRHHLFRSKGNTKNLLPLFINDLCSNSLSARATKDRAHAPIKRGFAVPNSNRLDIEKRAETASIIQKYPMLTSMQKNSRVRETLHYQEILK